MFSDASDSKVSMQILYVHAKFPRINDIFL